MLSGVNSTFHFPLVLFISSLLIIPALIWSLRFGLKTAIDRRATRTRRIARDEVDRELESINRLDFKVHIHDLSTTSGQEQQHDKKQERQRKQENKFNGFLGFFHPFANAGGGGERVLWAAIKATQQEFPLAISVIYTGDETVDKASVLLRVKSRFDIELFAPTIIFRHLKRRDWVMAESYPRLTLLMQSLGSIVIAHEALSLLVPDIFVDTMGYAFSTWYCKWLFPSVSTAAYVHYPFIGTHMVDSLTADDGHGVNAGSGKGVKGLGKKWYWNSLLWLYAQTGTSLDAVMVNSSWTQSHMLRLWGLRRRAAGQRASTVIYPPCSVEEIIAAVSLNENQQRERIILYIAQFRPEKNHDLLLKAFAKMTSLGDKNVQGCRLVLVGSVRDKADESLVYQLRIAARKLLIDDQVEFEINSSWRNILNLLQRSWVGVNGMWCEHFGIGVVEYQAAGLICVVNDSGGPKEDIVVPRDGNITGFHAHDIDGYAKAFARALTLDPAECQAMRLRSRESSKRFSTAIFCQQWTQQLNFILQDR